MIEKSILMLVCVALVKIDTSIISAPRLPTSYQHNFKRNSCWSMNNNLSRTIKGATCKPRETMVEVESGIANIMVFPNKVPVKRCNGGTCHGLSSCLPAERKMIKYTVRKHDFSTNKEFCETVAIEEHIKCRCGCSVMNHHCTAKQIYVPKECMCVCNNTDQEMTDCIQEGKLWDHKTCSCECRENYRECSTGTEWVPSICQCVKIYSDEADIYIDLP